MGKKKNKENEKENEKEKQQKAFNPNIDNPVVNHIDVKEIIEFWDYNDSVFRI